MSESDVAACHALLARGSKSFSTAGKLLPRRTRDAAAVLYAFCRVADDAVDDGRAPDRVDRLHRRLTRAYAGESLDDPIDRAFSGLVHRHHLPLDVFTALLEGFEWDARGRRYDTLSDVLAYAARVAATVGAAMTAILGRREPHVVARACDLGLAMQLTNIARDVGEDAAMGRVYLPSEFLGGYVAPSRCAAGLVLPPATLRSATLRLLDVADILYTRADAGIAALPGEVRTAIFAARHIYADIGRVVRKAGGDSLTRRAVVSRPRKLALLARAFLRARTVRFRKPDPGLYAPPQPEAAFLVEAIARADRTGALA